MSSVARMLHHPLRLLVAALLLLMLPFVGTAPRAAAMDQHAPHHTQHTTIDMDCAAACTRVMHVPLPEVPLKENETRTPDPDPQETAFSYQQLQKPRVPKKLLPAPTFSTLPSRPPDIVKLSGHFLF